MDGILRILGDRIVILGSIEAVFECLYLELVWRGWAFCRFI